MQQPPHLPPPGSNPLDMDEDIARPPAPPQVPPPGRQPNPRAELPADGGHEALQRGMPSRHLKTWAVAIFGTVVIRALLWPPQPHPGGGSKVATIPNQDLADELARRVPAAPEMRVDEPKVPPGPVAKTREEGDKAAEHMWLFLASPMRADVELRNHSAGLQPLRGSGAAGPPDASTLLRDMLARQGGGRRPPGEEGAAQGQGKGQGQGLHDDFLQESRERKIASALGMEPARAAHTLYEGTLIRTVLTRALRTDLPGRVTAKVMSDVFDSVTMDTLVIPRGSEVSCTYQSGLLVGQEVVLAACDRLRLPNGKSFSLTGPPAGDLQGASGLPADVNNHFWKMFKTSFMLGAASLLLPKDERQISIDTTHAPSQTGRIIGSALHDTIGQVLSRNTKIAPTGHVEIGTPFTLTIARDVEMEPYQGRE